MKKLLFLINFEFKSMITKLLVLSGAMVVVQLISFWVTVSKRLKEIFEQISTNYNISMQEWNHDNDHVHILFKGHPNSELSKFINAYKSASSRLIKKEFTDITKKLWKEYFWSRSFCLLTTGGAPIEIIKKYIETQGEKI